MSKKKKKKNTTTKIQSYTDIQRYFNYGLKIFPKACNNE
jgi:hypothetical protein